MVMYAGQLVETAPTAQLFATPGHPYTQALLHSIPRLTGPIARLTPIPGMVPQPHAWPAGCRFHPRCPKKVDACVNEPPPWRSPTAGTEARCWVVEGKV